MANPSCSIFNDTSSNADLVGIHSFSVLSYINHIHNHHSYRKAHVKLIVHLTCKNVYLPDELSKISQFKTVPENCVKPKRKRHFSLFDFSGGVSY